MLFRMCERLLPEEIDDEYTFQKAGAWAGWSLKSLQVF